MCCFLFEDRIFSCCNFQNKSLLHTQIYDTFFQTNVEVFTTQVNALNGMFNSRPARELLQAALKFAYISCA